MNTILINCSKDKAVVSDDNGRFLNRVANGIKIDVGDEISVEQIAINSIGVGSEIIEIPNQTLNYKYSTNQFALKAAFYIHHNYKFTCAMPLALKSGGGNMGDISVDVSDTLEARSAYGYLNGTPTQTFIDIIPRWEGRTIIERQSGIRYYLVDKSPNDNTGDTDLPSDKWYDFVEAEVPIEVDTGYDNPSNVAAKVSEDLKSIDLHPEYINSRDNPPPVPQPYLIGNSNNSALGKQQSSVSAKDALIQTRSVNFTNSEYTANSRMYSGIATTNPFLWKYGSRLNCAEKVAFVPGLGKKVNAAITGLDFQDMPPNQTGVFNLYDLERSVVGTGTNNEWNNGYVLSTNLEWNAANIETLAKFIRSQQQYEGGGEKISSSSFINESEEMKRFMFWSLKLGRANDYLIPPNSGTTEGGLWSPFSWNTAAVANPTLAAPIPPGASNPPNQYVGTLNSYFRQDLWDKRYLGQSKFGNAAPNQSINGTRPYKPTLADASAPNIIVSGVGSFDPYGVAKYYDINICAVKISGKDEGIATQLVNQTTTINVPAVPAVPDSYDLQNSTINNDGAVSLVSDFNVANNVIPLVLGGGAKQFTDDGGTPNNYSTSHFRHITFDAGAGNAVWVNFKKYAFEASSFAHYDRLYITASDNLADLNSSSGLLNNTKSPTLSPKLYQSASTSVSSGLGNSYVATNGGYGTGGGWVVPTECGDDGTNDMEGNNNSSWLDTWYKIDTRYVRFYFKSDGSSTDTGWEILVAPEIFTAGSPEIPATTTTTTIQVQQPLNVGDVPDEFVIGLVLNAKTLPTPVAPLGIARAGNYCLVDFGMTNPNNYCVQLLNPNTQVVKEDIANASPAVNPPADIQVNYINEIQVGSPNALFLFDAGRGRFGFQDLHWKLYTGNGYSATTASPPPDLNSSSSVAINAYNRIIDHFINPANLDPTDQAKFYPYTEYLCAESGVGLLDMGLYRTAPSQILNAPSIDYLELMNKKDRNSAFNGSLLSRFGFTYELLFNQLGLPCASFNSKYYDNNIPTKFVQLYPSPLTTNPLIDTAMALNFGNNANGQPNFDLNTLNGWKNINASSQSSTIYASNLPQKLVFPFWLIHSDLIGGIEFHSENQGSTSNIIAICNRSYTSGDFAYSFATDYTFTATKEYVVSGITTQILNPDLTPADINDRTSIVYKIQKRIPMFEAPQKLPDKKDPKDFKDTKADDRKRNDALEMPSVFSLT